MSKLDTGFWSETDEFFLITEKIVRQFNKGILPTICLCTNSPLGTITPTISRWGLFPQKTLSVKDEHTCIQLSLLTCLSLIVKVLI